MAEYVPFPTKADEVESTRTLSMRLLGCFGLGGLGVLGVAAALAVVFGGLLHLASCDTDIGSPGQGKDSQRLPVAVTPASDLAEDTTVRVTSDAFEPFDVVGVAVCLRSADTERRGVEACDEVQGARYAVSAAGRLDATYPVPRVITVGGQAFDCAASPKRCLVVAAHASNYDESGGRPITFRTGLPAAELDPVLARPETDHLPIASLPTVADGPVPVGTPLEVEATGFQPGEPLLLAYCTHDLEDQGLVGTCQPLDIDDAVSALVFRMIGEDFPTADADGAFSTRFEAQATVTPVGDDLGEALEAASSSTTTSAPRATTEPGATSTLPSLGDGEVRCTAATGGCSMVIAAAADTKRSAVLPFTVTG